MRPCPFLHTRPIEFCLHFRFPLFASGQVLYSKTMRSLIHLADVSTGTHTSTHNSLHSLTKKAALNFQAPATSERRTRKRCCISSSSRKRFISSSEQYSFQSEHSSSPEKAYRSTEKPTQHLHHFQTRPASRNPEIGAKDSWIWSS